MFKLFFICIIVTVSSTLITALEGDVKPSQSPAAQPNGSAAPPNNSPQLRSYPSNASAVIDEEKFEKYKDEVCNAVPELSNGNLPSYWYWWSDEIYEKHILELAFVNMAYGLSSDSVSYLKADLGWKKTVIDIISLITKATCNDKVINESFLNTAKNLFLYYMVKMSKSPPNYEPANITQERVDEWNEVIKSLSECAKAITPININMDCGKAMTFTGKDGEDHVIVEAMERLDQELIEVLDTGVDAVVDTVWWMFSTTYARCYSYFYPNEDVILVFFQMFRDDFLADFVNRWRYAGKMTEYFPIVFGPYDYETSFRNTRKCCAAAYTYEGLAERQLVRPLNVLIDNLPQRNYKV